MKLIEGDRIHMASVGNTYKLNIKGYICDICNFIFFPVHQFWNSFYVDYVDMCNCALRNVDFGMWLLQTLHNLVIADIKTSDYGRYFCRYCNMMIIIIDKSPAKTHLCRTQKLNENIWLFNLITITLTTPWSQSFSVVLILNRQFFNKRKKDPRLSICSPCH